MARMARGEAYSQHNLTVRPATRLIPSDLRLATAIFEVPHKSEHYGVYYTACKALKGCILGYVCFVCLKRSEPGPFSASKEIPWHFLRCELGKEICCKRGSISRISD